MSQDAPVTDNDTDTFATDAAPSTSFVPELDARQRAMLAEMGVRVWAPKPHPPLARPAADAVALPGVAASPFTPPAAAVSRDQAPPAPPSRVLAASAPPPLAPGPVLPMPSLSPMVEGLDAMDWASLRASVAACQACGLCEGRTQTVFGVGAEQADWLVVGDAPGATEDLQGEPYLGEAGQLLDAMLHAVGRSRTGEGARAAYVTHVLKCRPSTNRNPQPAEVAQCAHYLARQVALVQPRVILALGSLAAQALLNSQEPIGKLRGQVHQFQGVPVVVTFPPSLLVRTPANKGKAWADLCLALEQLPS